MSGRELLEKAMRTLGRSKRATPELLRDAMAAMGPRTPQEEAELGPRFAAIHAAMTAHDGPEGKYYESAARMTQADRDRIANELRAMAAGR